jgi:hypothetical protein
MNMGKLDLESRGAYRNLNRNYGGAEGDRTPDLCDAIVALSQLSYDPFHNTKVWFLQFFDKSFSIILSRAIS